MDRHNIGQSLAQIGKDPSPQPHPSDNRRETVIQQNQARGLACDIGPAQPHGYANMGSLKRRRIIDPIPGHGDDKALGLEGLDKGQLLLRRDPSKDPDGLDGSL